MSIQAVAWALDQDFSYTTAGRGPKGKPRETAAHGAKLVLISLCNHADHKSGHCWPSAETISRESSCSVRSVYRMVIALERNGFIDVKRSRGGQGKQRSNNYWIRFDREPAPWKSFDDERDEGSEDDAFQHDSVSPDDNTNDGLEKATLSPGRVDTPVTRHIMPEPSLVEPSAPPAAFDVSARQDEQAKLQAAEEARRGTQVAVIEGSKPWFAHVRAGHPPTLVGHIIVNGKRHRGWYFRADKCNGLYPKTGPPDHLTDADKDEIRKWG